MATRKVSEDHIEKLTIHFLATTLKVEDATEAFFEFQGTSDLQVMRRKWKVFLNELDMSFECFETEKHGIFTGSLQEIRSEVAMWRNKPGSILSYLKPARNADYHANEPASSQLPDHVNVKSPVGGFLGRNTNVQNSKISFRNNLVEDRFGNLIPYDCEIEVENGKVVMAESNFPIQLAERKAYLTPVRVLDRGRWYEVPRPKVSEEEVATFLGCWALDYLIYVLERFRLASIELGAFL